MKIQKNELAQKINKLKGIVPKKVTMPVLQGILVRDGYLIASNMELTVKAKIEGAEGESFIIPAKAFDLINNLPNEELEIIPETNKTITIKAEKIKNTYQTMDPKAFPVSEVPEDDNNITIKSEIILESMKRVSYAIPAQSGNQIMTALCLSAADGMLNFVGLDGHVIAWDQITYEGEFTLLIPKATVEKILSLGLEGDVAIKHSDSSAVFVTEEYEIYTRLIAGEYFKFQKMFEELPLHITMPRNEFLESITRAKMCVDEQRPVRLEFVGETLNISIKDTTTDYYETIPLQEELSQELIIGFNAKLIIETLKAFESKNIAIQMAGPKQPIIVKTKDSNFRALVLPVAMK